MFLAWLRRPLVLLAVAGTLAGLCAAAQTRIPPAPDRWATDGAGFLSRQTVAALDARLEAYERQTGHQFLVWIGRTIGENAVLEDWTVRAFEAWKVGRRGLDDGLVLFIFAEDRKIRIEVGYGLEDRVPDIYAYRVIDDILAPGIRAGRPDEAVEAAVDALIGHISGDATPAGGNVSGDEDRPGRGESVVKSVFTVIVIIFLIILFITNPSLAFWLLLSILGGGRGGGRGGGWGGGGGRSGGGGASGGW